MITGSSVLPQGLTGAERIIGAAEVEAGLARLAEQVQPYAERSDCLILGVLNGALFPMVHLADRLQGDFLLDYCHATRYRGETSGGKLVWLKEPSLALTGQTVIVVDDIWDEGYTLREVAEYCRQAGAAEVLTAVMFIKKRARERDMPAPDLHAGLYVPDRYVFGCGMDLHNRWRHLPEVYALTESAGEEGGHNE